MSVPTSPSLQAADFPEVRTVVAIKPNLMESLAMAGSAQDFQPRSALIVVSNQTEGNRIKALVKPPSRVLVSSPRGRYGAGITADHGCRISVAEGNFLRRQPFFSIAHRPRKYHCRDFFGQRRRCGDRSEFCWNRSTAASEGRR